LTIGPHPDAPDGIILSRFSRHPSGTAKRRPGKIRLHVPDGHALQDDFDVDDVCGTLHDRLKPTTDKLNQDRPLTKTDDHGWKKAQRATWQSEVKSQLEILSNKKQRTFVLCLSLSEYAEALSKYSAGPFSKQEENLSENSCHFPKDSTTTEEERVHQLDSQERETKPSSRIIKPYKAGYDYDSDPGPSR